MLLWKRGSSEAPPLPSRTPPKLQNRTKGKCGRSWFISRLWTEQRTHEHGNESLEIIQIEHKQTKHEKQNETGPPRPAGQYQTTEHTFIEVPVGEEKDRQKDEEIKAKNFPKSINGHK